MRRYMARVKAEAQEITTPDYLRTNDLVSSTDALVSPHSKIFVNGGDEQFAITLRQPSSHCVSSSANYYGMRLVAPIENSIVPARPAQQYLPSYRDHFPL